jgi:hypothetical protein
MSWRPVRKLAGIGNVFLGGEIVDIAEYITRAIGNLASRGFRGL